jgi:predicted amidohydrolase
MSVSTSFDLLLRGGRVIDPAGVDGLKDVAIRNGKIAAVQADISCRPAPGKSSTSPARSSCRD